MLMYIFYFRFTPKKAWVVLLAAAAFGLKIPFVIPVAFRADGRPGVDRPGGIRDHGVLHDGLCERLRLCAPQCGCGEHGGQPDEFYKAAVCQ